MQERSNLSIVPTVPDRPAVLGHGFIIITATDYNGIVVPNPFPFRCKCGERWREARPLVIHYLDELEKREGV